MNRFGISGLSHRSHGLSGIWPSSRQEDQTGSFPWSHLFWIRRCSMVKAVNLNSKQRQKVFWSGSHFSLVTLSICSPWLRWPKMIGFVVPALPWWHSDTSGVAAAPDTTVWCCNLVASCPSCRRHQWARLPATDHNNEPSKSNGEAAVDSRTSAKQWWVLCVWGGQQCGPCPPPLLWQEG